MTSETPTLGTTPIGETPFAWGERTYVMGIINVTPDSFSGDGVGDDVDAAVHVGVQIQKGGADIIDVGGASTRPASVYGSSEPTPVDEELARVVPVIEALRLEVSLPISVDTYRAKVAAAALAAGASMINDVWGLSRDSDMRELAAEAGVPVVLMHNQEHTRYRDLIPDVIGALRLLIEKAVEAGVDFKNIIVDPGVGFGKSVEQNLELLRRLDELRALNRPLLVGTSRKSTIGYVLDLPAEDRVEGTAATVALSIARGADVVRVHDVKQMTRVARMSDAIVRGWRPTR